MPELISDETHRRLPSFSFERRLAFLLLLYERMLPERRSFCLAEDFDFLVFQKAREEYWMRFVGRQFIGVLGAIEGEYSQ
jgi:uncharacterized protein YjaG (DUF416 family)